MLKTFILIITMVLVSVSGYTQTSGLYWKNVGEKSNRLQGKLRGEVYYINTLANRSFFLQDDWVTGTVVLTDGDEFENISFRYQAYGDKLVAFNGNINLLYTLDKSLVKSFEYIENGIEKKFISLEFKSYASSCRFFQELYKGSCSLLAFHHVDEVRVSPYTDSSGIIRDSDYRLNVDYYVVSEKNGFSKLQPRTRSVYKTYPEHKKEIRRLFKRNRISIQGESSMIKAFMLLDQEGLLE
jgi:hypothetical protein